MTFVSSFLRGEKSRLQTARSLGAERDVAETMRPIKKSIYDTTLPGYSNGGHTYGDPLTEGERTAVIEYLKTL
jgi:hypothetical protein